MCGPSDREAGAGAADNGDRGSDQNQAWERAKIIAI